MKKENKVIVDIYRVVSYEKDKLICTLEWDEEKKRVRVLKGHRFAKELFKGRYLDKEKVEKGGAHEYVSFKDGSKFIRFLYEQQLSSYIFGVRRTNKE